MGQAVQKTILLVEDEAIVSLATTRMLERHGFAVLNAATGETAVEIALAHEEIDLTLMDIDLGAGMDGTQAAEQILQHRDLPLVFLSSHTEEAVVDRTERITSYGYIVKNTGETVLLASIRMAFRLWEAEQKFRTAFENVQVGMVLVSPQGRLLRVNEEFARMLGYARHEITTTEFATLTHPDDIGPNILTMQAMLRGETDRTQFTKRFLHRNGEVVWADISTILLRNSVGEPLHFVTHARDITVERRNEAYRRQSEHILSSTTDGIALLDEAYRYRFVNRAYERFSGRSRESLTGLHVSEYLGEDFFREQVKQNFDRCLAGETIQFSTWTTYPALGRRFVHVTYSPYRDETGGICGVIANTRDITVEGEIQEELDRQRERLKAAEVITHLGHYDIDFPTGTALWSDETYRLFGLDPARFTPTMDTYASLIHEDDRDAVYAGVQESERAGTDFDMVYRIVHSSGATRYIHSVSRTRYDEHGVPNGLIGTIRDVTDEVESMNALLETRNRLASVFSAVPTGIGVVQGSERTIVEVNENLCAITGFSRAELLGRSARMLYPTQKDFEYVGQEKYRQIAEHGVGTVETRWKRQDGTIIEVLLSSAPIDPADHAVGVTFTAMDITARKQDERYIDALIREKEARAREIQHRVKNTMNTMVSLLTMQIDTLGSDSTAVAALNDARSRLRSMEVLYSMLYQADAGSDGSVREYLERLVYAVVGLFPLGTGVRPVVEIDEFTLDVRDLSTLGLIVNELVTNAMKYAFSAANPGVLSVTARRHGQLMSVTVHDSGPGFDPGSTTARSGFGLTMVRTLVEQLGGTLRLDHEEGMTAVVEWTAREDAVLASSAVGGQSSAACSSLIQSMKRP